MMGADGPAQRLLRYMLLLAQWLFTKRRPKGFPEPTHFDMEGVASAKGGYRGTLNMKWMAYTFAWVYSGLSKAPKEVTAKYRQRVIDRLRDQFTAGEGQWNGLMGGEQCSPGIHGSMWASAAAVLYLAAVLWKDGEMRALTGYWWRSYIQLAVMCHTATGEVVLPCANCRSKKPQQPLWTAVFREWINGQISDPSARYQHDKRLVANLKDGSLFDDHTNTPLAIGLVMRRRGLPSLLDVDPLGVIPLLHHPMDVWGIGGAYRATLERRQSSVDQMTPQWRSWVCHTVEVRGDKWTSERGWKLDGTAKEGT